MTPRCIRCVILILLAPGYNCWTLQGVQGNQRRQCLFFASLGEPSFIEEAVSPAALLDTDGVSSWLVCGDGDLSYCAAIAQSLSESNVSLTATVLEDQAKHHSVYANSKSHTERISTQPSSTVRFETDATKLRECFPGDTKFDRIQFNFPHWPGKANNRRNRELLTAFLESAVQVLSSDGQIHVAFCQGQGGSNACTLIEWKGSWLAAMYAAEHGLMLHTVEPYQPIHDLSAHRGVDRPFRVGQKPKLYRFGFPIVDQAVHKEIQLCCRHELHVVLPKDGDDKFLSEVVEGDVVQQIAQSRVVPKGIRVDVPHREIVSTANGERMVVFSIVYCGESIPLTRASADSFRAKLELEIATNLLPLRENRMGRLVSKPFPYSTLSSILEEEAKIVQ